MAKKITITNFPIESANDDWGGVNNSGSTQYINEQAVPAGAEWGREKEQIELWIRQQIASILSQQQSQGLSLSEKFGHAEWDGSSLKFYTEQGGGLLQTLGLTGNIYRIFNGYSGAQTFSVLTGDTSTIITINPTTTVQDGISGVPISFEETYDYTVAFNTGSGFVTLLDGQNVSGQVSIDIRRPLVVGTNQVRITLTGRQSDAVATLNLTVVVTALSFRCQHNWRLPWYEGQDYTIQGIYFSGALTKTLHIKIDDDELEELAQTFSAGENASTTARTLTIPSSYFDDLELSDSGQHAITMWMTTDTVKTPDVVFNILLVKENETAALVCINNVADKVMNFASTNVFDYYTLNADKIEFEILVTTADNHVSSYLSSNTNLTDGELNTLSIQVETPTELEGGTVEIDAKPYASDVVGEAVLDVIFALDNSLAFIAVSGAAFYMNAGVRANGDLNYDSIVDSVTGSAFEGTWQGMTWATDGWVTDRDGHRALALPAGCSVVFNNTNPLVPVSFMNNQTGLTIEMMLRASVVADFDTPILTFKSSHTSAGSTYDVGVFVYPTKILVRGTLEHTNDTAQEVNLCEDTITHIAITFNPNFSGNNGKNLCTVYINGNPNVAFAYDSDSRFGNGALTIGQDSTDVYLYMMRIYERTLDGTEIIQNLKNAVIEGVEFSRLKLDSDNAIYDNGIQYQLAKGKYNCFVIEPDDPLADIPSFYNQAKVMSTVYLEYAGHPERDTMIKHVSLDGQGTTSMRYFRWNIRGKFTDYKEEDGKVTLANEWYYKENGIWKLTPDFTGKEGFLDGYSTEAINASGHTKTQRATWKKNVASAPQGHKMGATALYDDLFTALGFKHELPDTNYRVAVWQEPFLGFLKSGNDYRFIGLYTGGPDKGCKTTFGYKKEETDGFDYSACMCIEGPNHNPRGTRFLHPWVGVWYDNTKDQETLKFGDEEAWDDDYSAGYDSDTKDAGEAAAILAMYVSEWKPAYDLVYHCSPYIAALTEATINGVALGVTDSDALDAINADIETFWKSMTNGEKNELMSFYDSNYDIYYYSNTAKEYVKLVRQDGDSQDGLWNIVTYLGNYLTAVATDEPSLSMTEKIIKARANKFKAEMGQFFSLNQALYHKNFCMLIGAKDNDAKNTYPFKHLKLSDTSGKGRWGWKQDDLDSLFATDNNGMATVKYSVEHGDKKNGVEIFQGSDSAFWTLIWRNYQSSDGNTASLQSVMVNIMNALNTMSSTLGLPQDGTLHDRVIRTLEYYFFGKSAKYFPIIAYQEDRAWTYIEPWLLTGQAAPDGTAYPSQYNRVEPLTQALGDRYQDERLWIERRVAYLFSKYSIGAFNSMTEEWGSFEFGLLNAFTFRLTPAIDFYPSGNVGGAARRGSRVLLTGANDYADVSMPASQAGTALYIKAVDWLSSLGDLCKTQFVERTTGDPTAELSITAKRLEVLKVGDADPNEVLFNAIELKVNSESMKVVNGLNTTSLIEPVDLSACPRLRQALFAGSHATGLELPAGSRVTHVSYPDNTLRVILHSQNQLTAANLTLPATSYVVSYYFNKCANLDPFAVLSSIGNNALSYVTMIWDGTLTVNNDSLAWLIKVSKMGSVLYEGEKYTNSSSSAVVSGSIHVTHIYTEDKNLLLETFPNLTITADTEDAKPRYLCFTALEEGTFSFKIMSGISTTARSWIEYSLDGGLSWTRTTNVANTEQVVTTPTVMTGETVLWRGSGSSNANNNSFSAYCQFSSTGRFNVSGQVDSIHHYSTFMTQATATSYAFSKLFMDCTKLISSKDIELKNPASGAVYTYYQMFYRCSSMIDAPSLAFVTNGGGQTSFGSMFAGCSSLTVAPQLPNVTSLPNSAFSYMFSSCTSLVTGPSSLPATTIGSQTYQYMFNNCTSLTTAPTIAATTIGTNSFSHMFYNCTSLVTPPPTLSALTLMQACYEYMFSGCTSLTTAPAILATTLATQCCRYMFEGCTSLVNAPELPATTLATTCYFYMFSECTSLVNAPTLPAETTVDYCYGYMFNLCSSLSYIKMYATTIPGTQAINYWMRNVKNVSSCIFVKRIDATWTTTGGNGVPTNWTVIYYDPTDDKYYTDQTKAVECNDHGVPIHMYFADRRVREICAYYWGDTREVTGDFASGSITPEGTDTDAFSDFIFACTMAIPAHKSHEAWEEESETNDLSFAAHTEQFTVVVTASAALTDIVVQEFGSATNATPTALAADISAFTASGNVYTATVTCTTGCQYLRIGVKGASGTTVSYTVSAVNGIRIPVGITEQQAGVVNASTNIVSVFMNNTLITTFDEFSKFGNMTIGSNYAAQNFCSGCSNLVSIGLDNVTHIQSNATYHPLKTSKVEVLKIPNTDNISGYLIRSSYLPNITRLFVGDKVTNIDQYGFSSARASSTSPTYVVIRSTTPPTTNASGGALAAWAAYLYVYVPDDSIEAYKAGIFANNTSKVFKISEYPFPEELT